MVRRLSGYTRRGGPLPSAPTARADTLAAGARLGRYEIGRVLGHGGEGTVYAAVLRGPGGFRKPVALKILRERSAALQREARIGGLLRHRHLVDVYEIGEDAGTWFCAMELCDGVVGRPLPPRAVVEVGRAVCSALTYAHSELGLVHLDVKPDNLLLARGVPKLADLGIARARGFALDGIRGTPGYMAPEQARGGAVDPRTDVYALGVSLVELATGRRPRGEATGVWDDAVAAAEAHASAPAWLAEVAARCLAFDPRDRWASPAALDEALAALPVDGPGLREHLGATGEPEPTPSAEVDAGDDAFVGRTAERAAVARALRSGCLLTLKGPPGIGKSRLAAVGARGWRGGRAWSCDAAQVRTPEELAAVVAGAFGIEIGASDAVTHVGHAVAGRGAHLLLVDNLPALPALAQVIGAWHARAPEARLLVTSPARLGVAGEQVLEVEVLPPTDAVALLRERALARGVAAGDDALAELASRLDGVPLALELAAGRLGVLSVADVLARLDLPLLRGDAGDRHATLQATIAWSWDQLSAPLRRALAELAAFVGPFTLDAAEAVLAPGTDAVDVVERLLASSWLAARGDRYALLSVVGAHAAAARDDGGAAEVRHGRWAARLGEDAALDRAWQTGAREQRAAIGDLVAATRRAIARGDPGVATRAALAAATALATGGPVRIGFDLVRAASDVPGIPAADRLRLRHAEGRLRQTAGELDLARALVEEARDGLAAAADGPAHALAVLTLASIQFELGAFGEARRALEGVVAEQRARGDRCREGMARGYLGILHARQGRPREAEAEFAAALAAHREVGATRAEAVVLGNLGNLYREMGQRDRGREHLAAALAGHRASGDRRMEGIALGNMGIVLAEDGDLEGARAAFESALAVHREVGNRRFTGIILGNLATVHRDAGRIDAAVAAYAEALVIHREVRAVRSEGIALGNLADLERRRGDLALAREHLDAAERLLALADDRYQLGLVACARARLCRDTGDEAGASAALERARESVRSVGASADSELARTLAALATGADDATP